MTRPLASALRHATLGWVLASCGTSVSLAATDDPLADWLQTQGLVTLTGENAEANTPTHALAGLVVHAMAYLDTPYRLGGNSFSEGLDCSGFIQAAYRHSLGIALPRRAVEQAQASMPIERSDLVPGDLVFFNTQGFSFSHVGLYVGDGKFIHAPRAGARIRQETMTTNYWVQRFDGARRVGGLVAGVTPTVTP